MKKELICYKKMPVWTANSLPQMFQEKHNTKVGTWGKLTVLKGKLKFTLRQVIMKTQPFKIYGMLQKQFSEGSS